MKLTAEIVVTVDVETVPDGYRRVSLEQGRRGSITAFNS